MSNVFLHTTLKNLPPSVPPADVSVDTCPVIAVPDEELASPPVTAAYSWIEHYQEWTPRPYSSLSG